MSTVLSWYCYAIRLKNAEKSSKTLEVHEVEKTEKPLQILHFSLFRKRIAEPAFMFPKP